MTGKLHDALRAQLEDAGQTRLLSHLDRLQGDSHSRLISELSRIDIETLKIQRDLIGREDAGGAADLAPAPSIVKGADPAADANAAKLGWELLEAGRVGAFVVAGGQGSRLGYDGPKGCFPATPVKGACLFEVFAAKILATGKRYGHALPWYVMVSCTNEAKTKEFFQANDNFGLNAADVFFVCQAMLPALSSDGEVLLASADEIFWSPNGHGGSLLALASGGALDDMKQRGIEQLFYFQVDNPLLEIADPIFLGYHKGAHAGMSTKVVAKRDAGEKVGVVGLIGGKHGVIEYSDLSPEELSATGTNGELRFNDGNIAVHFLERSFIEHVSVDGSLPFHLARKSVRFFDPESGEEREGTGIKFETFIFDALRESAESVVLRVDRRFEFAPIKNAEGNDSPETSKAAQSSQFAGWLEECGVDVKRDESGCPVHPIEISPLFALDADELLTRDLEGLSLEDGPINLE